MNKKIRISFMILSVLGVSFLFGVWLRTKTAAPEKKVVSTTTQKKSPRFKAIMKEPLKKKEQILTGDNYSCRKDLELLIVSSVEDIKSEMIHAPIALGKDCLKSLNDIKSPIITQEMQKCLQKNQMENAEACNGLIAFLRAYLLTKEAGNKSLKDRELKELIAELMWNFIKGPTPTEAELERNIQIADEMIERDPTLFDAYKAKLVNLFVAEMNHNKNINEQFEKALEEAKELGENDPEVESLPLVRQISKGNWTGVDEWAEDRMETNPEDYRGFYAKSAYFWQNKNAGEAIRYMNRAVQLNPNDADLIKTLNGLKTRDYDLKHFQMKLGFKFDDF